jgi:hypothetical protein
MQQFITAMPVSGTVPHSIFFLTLVLNPAQLWL